MSTKKGRVSRRSICRKYQKENYPSNMDDYEFPYEMKRYDTTLHDLWLKHFCYKTRTPVWYLLVQHAHFKKEEHPTKGDLWYAMTDDEWFLYDVTVNFSDYDDVKLVSYKFDYEDRYFYGEGSLAPFLPKRQHKYLSGEVCTRGSFFGHITTAGAIERRRLLGIYFKRNQALDLNLLRVIDSMMNYH